MSLTCLPRSEARPERPRVRQRFRMPAPDRRSVTAHTAVRGAAVGLIRAGQHHDARELLLATVKSALRSWCLAIGYDQPAWSTDVLYYARLLREVHQISRPTYRAINKLARGPFNGNTATEHLLTVREIHDAVYWTGDDQEGGAA